MSRLSHARLRPYLKKSNEDPHSAMKLYQWNIELSGAVYETLHRVEVIFRNALDEQLSIWNASQVNQQTGQSHSSDWLLDPSHLLQRLLGVNDHPKSGQIRQLKTSPRLLSLLCLVLLFFAGKCRVCVFEPVAAAFEGDHFGVVNDPVDHC